MTQEELIEEETRQLVELTVMLQEVNLLLDQAMKAEEQGDKVSLLSQAYKTLVKYEGSQQHALAGIATPP